MNMLERRALQLAVAAGSLVPIGAGGAGVFLGVRLADPSAIGSADLDSHFRYLSGLLLAIGLGFASTVPEIQARGRRFRLLTGIVVLGGAGRLFSILTIGVPSSVMVAALVMELAVTPALAIWQRRAERSRGEPAPR